VLLAFSEGRLKSGALAEVVAHLDACPDCLTAVGPHGSRPLSRPLRTSFSAGDLVAGRYRIAGFVARGGMGEVYRAADQLLGIEVALKTVLLTASDDPRAVELLRREVRVARAISHPGVCRVYDLGEHVFDAGTEREARLLFLTMQFLEGTTLGQRVRTQGRLGAAELVPVARQLAEALQAAHDAGVVHRDFKSDNVMWLAGEPGRVVVMDFGLARVGAGAAGLSTTGGLVVGSAAYMAPEQVEGSQVDAAADVYALGVVLFEAATGRLPFEGATAMATALKRLREDPPRPRGLVPELSAHLEHVILRCMARKRGDRFASMAEVLAVLEPGAAPTQKLPVRRGRRRLVALAAVGAGAALLAGVAAGWRGGPAGKAPEVERAALPAVVPAERNRGVDGTPPIPAGSPTAPAALSPGLTVETPPRAARPPEPVPASPVPSTKPAAEKKRRVRSAPAPVPAAPASESPPAAAPRSQSDLDGFPNPYK
jgi:hypothetical protein